jgi:hypothetical protein
VKGRRSSTYKRVVVRKLDKGLVKGFVDPATYLSENKIQVLDRDGRLVSIPIEEVKGLFFVREFEGNPQHAERKVFHSRPRLAGLWVRMTFKDNEVLEGLIPNNLLEIDPLGYLLTPPDVYSNNLKIFIPRSALATMEVLGVIAEGVARRLSQRATTTRVEAPGASKQIGLFPAPGSAQKK